MIRKTIAGALTALVMMGVASTSHATSLQVSPVLIDVPAPGASSKLTLKNVGSEQIKAQVRIFKWIQRNGKDELIPTRDVVASPPLVKISPNGKNLIRIIRVSKKPTDSEEAYRLIVDQLPARTKKAGVAVRLQMRYSIPVFFGAKVTEEPRLAWTVNGNGSRVSVANQGARHVRVSELLMKTPSGKNVGAKKGLVGYILSNSMANFDIKLLRKVKKGTSVLITANAQNGQIKVKSRVQ